MPVFTKCSSQAFLADPNKIWRYIGIFCKEEPWCHICRTCLCLHTPCIKKTTQAKTNMLVVPMRLF
jgi:hypothetical protein